MENYRKTVQRLNKNNLTVLVKLRFNDHVGATTVNKGPTCTDRGGGQVCRYSCPTSRFPL